MTKMKTQLVELLSIHGISGNEEPVRKYLEPILSELMDTTFVDEYGNLLAQKKLGNGKGATILLSAHMDTVRGVLAERNLVEDNGFIHSDKGVLGADDRAGIAIILEVLRHVSRLETFNGTIKVAFSREEEIGCIGADKIDPLWTQGTDLAIVVDRRGNRDIVVGCTQAFCSNEVGDFMENVSQMIEQDWSCVEGGISDAMSFSEKGINSINISAGYENEHTDKEWVSLDCMKDSVLLILQTIAVINQFCVGFGEVPENNNWVQSYSTRSKYYYGAGTYYEDGFEDDTVWAEEVDVVNGDVYLYDVGNNVIIQQKEQEIIMSRAVFNNLMKQLKS